MPSAIEQEDTTIVTPEESAIDTNGVAIALQELGGSPDR